MSELFKKLKVIKTCNSYDWDTYRKIILMCNSGGLTWIDLRYDNEIKKKFDYDIHKDIHNQNTWSTMEELIKVKVDSDLVVYIECWDSGFYKEKRWSGEVKINEDLLSLFASYIEREFHDHVFLLYKQEQEEIFKNRLREIKEHLLL